MQKISFQVDTEIVIGSEGVPILPTAFVLFSLVTYVTLVMSIGLLVDFVMHIALRYFESKEQRREDKAREVLRTMGTPVFLAGASTFLGVLPLSLASSSIIYTIVIAFIGMVVLGVTHGLIFLPVILSIIGPEGAPTDTIPKCPSPTNSAESVDSLPEAVSPRVPSTDDASRAVAIESLPTTRTGLSRKPDPPDADFVFVPSFE